MLNVAYDPINNLFYEDLVDQNGELYVPPLPGYGFVEDLTLTQVPYDSEILQSFAELTHIKHIKFNSFDFDKELYESGKYERYQQCG